MTYVMVTGPMGAGKSTFMRSLPKPWNDFIIPKTYLICYWIMPVA